MWSFKGRDKPEKFPRSSYINGLRMSLETKVVLGLQWVIENFAHKEGKIHSEVFEAGGFYW